MSVTTPITPAEATFYGGPLNRPDKPYLLTTRPARVPIKTREWRGEYRRNDGIAGTEYNWHPLRGRKPQKP